MRKRKTILIILGNVIALLILLQEVKAQRSEGYIYGKVIALDNEYQGRISWGGEEVFWHNYFNAAKLKKSKYYEKSSSNSSDVQWKDFDWDFRAIWEDKVSTVHQFSCQFGDIASIKNVRRNEVLLILKNGFSLSLDGNGYNDIGATITIYDDELGVVKVDWDRIDKVEFTDTPKDLYVNSEEPIYGKVKTLGKGSYTGFVQWDHDERLLSDKLDGDTRGADLSIPFKQIAKIEKNGNGCDVLMKSGREYLLTGSNDVDGSNRGVIVYVPGTGRVDISWKHFQSLELIESPNSGPAYRDFQKPEGIKGSVLTVKNIEYSGKIIYDLDEEWELETLDAKDDGVSYEIPFSLIKRIIPKNYAYSQIELRNGSFLILGESRDVDSHNAGLMVLDERKRAETYIKWDQIVEIKFD